MPDLKNSPLFIFGPTGSGKSKLALALAQVKPSLIINADACQIYQELPILTAQPSKQEQALHCHALYGYHSIYEQTDVAKWLDAVKTVLDNASGKQLIFVGGTGFYLKVLEYGLPKATPVSEETTQTVKALLEKKGAINLYETLQNRYGAASLTFHYNDHQRLIRAYALHLTKGIVPSLIEDKEPSLIEKPLKIAINPERLFLRNSLEARLQQMVEEGLLDEVHALSEPKLAKNLNNVIGLKELLHSSSQTLSTDIEKVFYRTCQYAKRQRTWLRHQYGAHYVLNDKTEEENFLKTFKAL